jgi:phenylacetate-CoA ligase
MPYMHMSTADLTNASAFYPRTHQDVRYALLSWGRSFPCMGIGPGKLCHLAFPIGIHPAGQVWARSAQLFGVGMTLVGAGNVCPSDVQLKLIETLKPTVFLGMSSFALHLANLAEANGIDLAASSVRKVVCSGETLSDAKREKIAVSGVRNERGRLDGSRSCGLRRHPDLDGHVRC